MKLFIEIGLTGILLALSIIKGIKVKRKSTQNQENTFPQNADSAEEENSENVITNERKIRLGQPSRQYMTENNGPVLIYSHHQIIVLQEQEIPYSHIYKCLLNKDLRNIQDTETPKKKRRSVKHADSITYMVIVQTTEIAHPTLTFTFSSLDAANKFKPIIDSIIRINNARHLFYSH